MRRWLPLILLLALAIAWKFFPLGGPASPPPFSDGSRVVPVEAAHVVRGTISLRRTFSGALEAGERFVVAPKVSGRVETLAVDIGDRVQREQLVARLDHGEYSQAVTQAEADLAVARANLTQAQSNLDIANRDLERIRTLRKRGVSSESQLDAALSRRMSTQAGLSIAVAQVTRATAALETARIRLGYTNVTADWRGGDHWRVVAESFVAEGDTVSANTPLAAIVDLNPLTCVIYVTERDYGRLKQGLEAELSCEAFPGRKFRAKIARIAPVFRETTRQARVELSVENDELLLKPGMFVSADLVLATLGDAVIVPETAVTSREDGTGVFFVNEEDLTVAWIPVTAGIHEADRVQVTGIEPPGRVVTLGQHLLSNGSSIVFPGEHADK